jgi:hypothetical protein
VIQIQRDPIHHIARTSIARIISEPALWRHFANVSALNNFWAKPEHERKLIWGNPVNALEPLDEFNPKYILDRDLGAHE